MNKNKKFKRILKNSKETKKPYKIFQFYQVFKLKTFLKKLQKHKLMNKVQMESKYMQLTI